MPNMYNWGNLNYYNKLNEDRSGRFEIKSLVQLNTERLYTCIKEKQESNIR